MRGGVVAGFAGVVALATVGVAALIDGGDSVPQHRSATAARPIGPDEQAARDEIAARRAVEGTVVPASEAFAALRAGASAVVEGSGTEVTCRVMGSEAGRVDGTTYVDRTDRKYDSRQTTDPVGDGEPFTEERRLLDGRLYVRVLTSGIDPATTRWDDVALPNGDAAELDRVLTAFGRIADSLERVSVLIEGVPGRVERLTGSTQATYRVTLSARRIGDFYLRTGLEALDHPPDGTTTFEFGLDDSGTLAHVSQYGTAFHDGEALERAFVGCRYAGVPRRVLTPPAPELIRP